MTNFPIHTFPKLDLISPDLIIEKRESGLYVVDLLRKQWLLLTPEEWVRQHALHWLLTQTRFPASLLSIEKQVNQKKRADIIGYDRLGKPLLLVECKSSEIKIKSQTAQQALIYNQTLKAPFVWLTNGIGHFVLRQNSKKTGFDPIPSLPVFEEMLKK